MPKAKTNPSKRTEASEKALTPHFRSGLEKAVATSLTQRGIPVRFEQTKIKYEVPARMASYLLDFELPNGIIVETKGRFDSDDRRKHLLIKASHPDLDIRFLFSNPNAFIGSQKSGAFRAWLKETHGILVVGAAVKAKYKPEWMATLEQRPSQTTYAMWCEKYGFKYAKGPVIPQEWIDEAPRA